nr:MAG TPA: hypothetical protein [Caudoviricetes sp.]
MATQDRLLMHYKNIILRGNYNDRLQKFNY